MAWHWQSIPKDEQLARLALPARGAVLAPDTCKQLAVTMALTGIGNVAPNPLVGAVLVDREHRFLAAGAHRKLGGHHGEMDALATLDALGTPVDLKSSTLYVTLEPCAHHNRTPACAPQLVKRQIGSVVYGITDPNPLVNGQGAAILTAAGTTAVKDPAWQTACEQLVEIFLWNMRHQRPFIALKAATTLNGVMARAGDRRAWITGARARQYGHFLRAYFDAIVVGCTTILNDDPILDTRDALITGRNPFKIVLDPSGRALLDPVTGTLTASQRLLQQEPQKVIWVVTPETAAQAAFQPVRVALQKLGAQVLTIPRLGAAEGFDLPLLVAQLYEQGLTSLLLEGGAGVYGSFLRAQLVSKIYLFQAAKIFGGLENMYWAQAASNHQWYLGDDKVVTPLADDWLVEAECRS